MNPRDTRQWIDLQVSALFICDAHGRLRYINEPGYDEAELDPAPRLFMGRTTEGNLWRFRHDLPDHLVRDLEQICRSEPVAVDLTAPPVCAAAIRAALQAHAPITREERGPAYWIPQNLPVFPEVVLISQANAHLLETHFPWKLRSASSLTTGPIAAAVVEERAVSICYCSRLTPLAAEAGVQTIPAERGRGFARAAVAGWASAVRQRGLIPLYSTSWENLAS